MSKTTKLATAVLAAAAVTGPMLATPAHAADDIVTLGTRYCHTSVSVSTAGKTTQQVSEAMGQQMAKVTPLLGEYELNGEFVRVEIDKIDVATGTFQITAMEYPQTKIDSLYKYDYRVSAYDVKCMTAW